MTRPYRLGRRAIGQQDTRRRIVEAAVALHTTIGPARTSVSAIARRAGVERHTFYSHFPNERSLVAACSALHGERRPLPDPESWREVGDPVRRLRRGLAELYAFYERNGAALAPILRDAATHQPTRAIVGRRLGAHAAAMRDVLAAPFRARGTRRRRLLALLDLFLSLDGWRLLTTSIVGRAAAVEVVVRAIAGQ